MSEPSADFRRLHPASLVFRFFDALQTFFVPALLVWLWSDAEHAWEVWLGALFVPVVLAHVLHYVTFRYAMQDEDLIVRHGIFVRRERHIPYARIENVDLLRNPVHRLLGVAIVRLDTAAGEDAEAQFKVLSMPAVTELLEAIRDRATGGAARGAESFLETLDAVPSDAVPPDEAEGGVVLRASLRDLVVIGIVSHRGLVAVAAIVGVLSRFDVTEKLLADSILRPLVTRWVATSSGSSSLGQIALLASFAIVGLFGMSIAWTIFRYHGYRLEASDGLLRWRAGAWTERRATIPVARIQRLTVRRTLLHRLLGFANLRIETAGARDDEERAGRSDFVPLCRWTEVERLVAICIPDARFPSSYEPVDASAQNRATRLALITSLVSGALAYPLIGLVGCTALTVALVPVLLVRARCMTAFLGLAVVEDCLWVRRGAFHLAWIAVPISKIQTMAVAISPFDRSWDMARLVVDVAGASSADVLTVPYLSHAVAMRHYEQLGRGSAAIELAW